VVSYGHRYSGTGLMVMVPRTEAQAHKSTERHREGTQRHRGTQRHTEAQRHTVVSKRRKEKKE
jgi:hypothetical protein